MDNKNFLGAITNLFALLGVLLYFTGWIYRWAYFGFFQLEVTTLDLSLESFLIVPFQVFLGSALAVGKTILAFVICVLLIKATIWLLNPLNFSHLNHQSSQLNSTIFRSPRILIQNLLRIIINILSKIHESWLFRKTRKFLVIFPPSLLQDSVVVIWILIVLFWLAQLQGISDARRDAINQSSTRPVVAIVSAKNALALGRNLDNLLADRSMSDYQIIGDPGLFERLVDRDINDKSGQRPIVWRLLLERNGWLYIFPSLPNYAPQNERPYVLVIRSPDSSNQLLILSPRETQ